MKKIIDFKSVKREILTDQILLDYEKQQQFLPFLPPSNDFREIVTTEIATLQKEGIGWCFYNNNQLTGFLAGYKLNTFFGKTKGIYIPLYGHGVFGNDEKAIRKTYQDMYAYACTQWVKEDFLSHAITVYAKNPSDVDTWFWLGFGNRCVDSIKTCKRVKTLKEKTKVKKATFDDLESIVPMEEKNHEYFKTAPLLMPMEDIHPLESLKEWFFGENRHLWIAFQKEKPVGFMRIQNEGESFISYHKSVMNITGAYILPEKRERNIATQLLNEIQRWLLKNNYPLLGVDFESFNIKGASFWNKHFTPYTFSLTRRIDERITAYKSAFQEY